MTAGATPAPVSPAASAGDNDNVVQVAVITARNPALVSKHFLYLNGEVIKRTSAEVYSGQVDIVPVAGLPGFANLLASLGANQCVTYGLPAKAPVELVTEKEWAKLGRPATHIARTKDAFAWADGPGVLMLDYDAPKDGGAPLGRDDLVAAVRAACPSLAGARMLWWPSTSSCIRNSATDEEVYGVKGQRLYIVVQNAQDIERAGKALLAHLWGAGQGRIDVSKSGALLERGLFDASVWQANRIDFAAGALCTEPLIQERGAPIVIEGATEFVDTVTAIPDPSPEVQRAAEDNRRKARAAVRSTADRRRDEWVEARAIELVERMSPAPLPVENEQAIAQAKERVRRAIEQRSLPGDWPIQFADGTKANVIDVLDRPAMYHGRLTLDPLEPDYDGGRPVGKLYLYSARPNLHSFAHGGRTFRLERRMSRIELVRGRSHDTVNAFLEVMREAHDLYDFGSSLVMVDGGKVVPLTENSLRHRLGGEVQCFTFKKGKAEGEVVEQLEDPPLSDCRAISDLGQARALKRLVAIITAPTLRPDDTVLAAGGFDAATGLLLVSDAETPAGSLERPTKEEAKAALALLWRPFERFPFVGPLDRAAHLAAILTAVVRPGLPTAPAFAYDAPAQGSGKTLLAQCVATIAAGEAPDVWPPSRGRDDEENRKRLLTAFLSGKRAVVIDNLIGTFDSPSLAAALTSEVYADRQLGSSTECRVPNRVVFVLSGNNLMLAGDMPRRTLTCRIDPRSEAPYAREFDLDPKAFCMENRHAIAVAALTLIRLYLSSGIGRLCAGRMASFERWDDVVRQTIIYVDRELAPGQFGDVMEITRRTQANDPEFERLGRLLGALRAVYGTASFTAAEVHSDIGGAWIGVGSSTAVEPRRAELADVIRELTGGRYQGKPSIDSIGRLLTYRRDRLASGMRIVGEYDSHRRSTRWHVESVDGASNDSGATIVPWLRVANR